MTRLFRGVFIVSVLIRFGLDELLQFNWYQKI